MNLPSEFEIGGRRFQVPADRSLLNDHRITQILQGSGLLEFEVLADESPEAFRDRVLDQALASESFYLLWGSLLLPAGMKPQDWTEEVGKQTGAFLREQLGPEAKNLLRIAFAKVLETFFASGAASLWTSPTSSMAGESVGVPDLVRSSTAAGAST